MTKVLVLGAGGMLGSMVARVLSERPDLEATTTTRGEGDSRPAALAHRHFDVLRDPIGPLLDEASCDWIINAVGVLKPRIDEHDPASTEEAIAVNSLFPHRLAAESAQRGQRVIQIATDGVFSGMRGPYDEEAPHDALDVYGKTKSLGEVPTPNVVHLRCSIIGTEQASPVSLLGWALSASPGAHLHGYSEQRWNGVTTLQFARVCAAVIGGVEVPSPQHLVPADSVSKADLLEIALSAFGREDVTIDREAGPPIDRTLTTRDREANERLWRGAGYRRPPTIADMVRELAGLPAQAAGGIA
jgi:dTDP-4-dehydrorhamnose reductase